MSEQLNGLAGNDGDDVVETDWTWMWCGVESIAGDVAQTQLDNDDVDGVGDAQVGTARISDGGGISLVRYVIFAIFVAKIDFIGFLA